MKERKLTLSFDTINYLYYFRFVITVTLRYYINITLCKIRSYDTFEELIPKFKTNAKISIEICSSYKRLRFKIVLDEARHS